MKGVWILVCFALLILEATSQNTGPPHSYKEEHNIWNSQRDVGVGGSSSSTSSSSQIENVWTEEERRFLSVLERAKNVEKNVILPIFSNLAWVDMTVNLVRQFQSVDMTDGYFIYAWDEETCVRIKSHIHEPLECYFNTSAPVFDKTDQVWGTVGYFQMIDQRLSIIEWIHKKTTMNTLMIDTDVIIKKNLYRYLKPDLYDLQFQEEIPAMVFEDNIPTLNGGCWFARNSPIMETWIALSISYMMNMNLPDQDAMNYALKQLNAQMSFAPFPKDAFPNGFLYFISRYTEYRPETESEVAFVHSNWISGFNGKFTRIFDEGAWLISNIDYATNSSQRRDLIFKYGPRRQSEHISRKLSLDGQIDRIRKLLHVALKFGGSISALKMACYPDINLPYECGMDIVADFNSINEHITILPTNIDLWITNQIDMDISTMSLPSSILTHPGVDTVIWIDDPTDLSYESLKTSHPLEPEIQEKMDNIFSLSGFIANDVLTSYRKYRDGSFLCVYDDAQAKKDTNALSNRMLSDIAPLTTSDYKIYWVDSGIYKKPKETIRMYTIARNWQSDVYSGWYLLWYGMRELEGHVLPGYIQSIVCGYADKVYINAPVVQGDNWFVDRVCNNRTFDQSPCVFM